MIKHQIGKVLCNIHTGREFKRFVDHTPTVDTNTTQNNLNVQIIISVHNKGYCEHTYLFTASTHYFISIVCTTQRHTIK